MAERERTVPVAFPSLHPSPAIKSVPAVIKKKIHVQLIGW